jgi:hypothetical protein
MWSDLFTVQKQHFVANVCVVRGKRLRKDPHLPMARCTCASHKTGGGGYFANDRAPCILTMNLVVDKL